MEEDEDHQAGSDRADDEDGLASVAIREDAEQRLSQYGNKIGGRDSPQHRGALEAGFDGVRQSEDVDDGVDHREGRAHADTDHGAPVRAEHLDDGNSGRLVLFLEFLEYLRLIQGAT